MTKRKLTKPQYEALAKWENGKSANWTANRVREDVFFRLMRREYLVGTGFLCAKITDKGRDALAEYRKGKQ